MKEVTYEDWQKNPTPRMMWVWDRDEVAKKRRKVIYFLGPKAHYPVAALNEDETITVHFKHCAEGVTMFEKEAEEYLDIESKYLIEDDEGNVINIAKKVKQAFKDGAEFGYYKANEWHYPSKGEYPKEGENVLCYCKCRTEIKFYSTGHTVIGGDNKIRWWSSDRSEKLNVYAWKEIVLPKETEENEN